VGSWLQQAEQSFATIPGADDDDQDVGRDSMMSFGVQSLSTSMAASGGIGIGKMIAKAMHAAADKAGGQQMPTDAARLRPFSGERSAAQMNYLQIDENGLEFCMSNVPIVRAVKVREAS
jgi:Rod binding domain-containing protein